MENYKLTDDLILSLEERLKRLAAASLPDQAYWIERRRVQIEMTALYKKLSGENLNVEEEQEPDNADMQDKGQLGVVTGTVDLMKKLILNLKVAMKHESDADRILLSLEKKGLELFPNMEAYIRKHWRY